jgi:thymidylate synthase (FAD)
MRDTVPAADQLIDLEHPVLDHGFVILTDYMGSDAAIARAARTSLAGEGTRTTSDDRALIRRLVRDRHTSPLEMVELKFLCQMPIFVARQWIRHRTANVNEMSGRYGEMPELVYVPEPCNVSYQSPLNKQGRGSRASETVAQAFVEDLAADAIDLFDRYHGYLGKGDKGDAFLAEEDFEEVRANGGISRELARINLPLSTYTKWVWKIDLHNLLHFLGLRLDPHAQWEIRQYAMVMARMVEALCPVAYEAFRDFELEAVTLSGPEVEALRYLQELRTQGDMARSWSRSMSKSEVVRLRLQMDALGLAYLLDQAGSPFAGA